jgi:hypothetical protein
MKGYKGLARIDQATRWLDRWLPQVEDDYKQLVQPVAFKRAVLYPKQAAVVDDPARFTITEGTTKSGKTMSHLEWQLDEAAKIGYGNHWWIATVYKTSEMAYDRAKKRLKGYVMKKGVYQKVHDAVPPHLYKTNDTSRIIQLGGARIWYLSADRPDNLFGEDVITAVGDEITRWREAAYTAVYTTLTATGGRFKMIGNVKGRHNYAYALARRAESGHPGWAYHKLTAWDAVDGGVVDKETIEGARRDLPEAVFKELYLAEAADDGSNPFGIEKIEQAFEAQGGQPADGPVVAYGVDLGEHHDFTWVIGLNEAGQMVEWHRFQQIGWDEQIQRVQKIVGRKRAMIDATGVGDPVFQMIAKKCRRAEAFKYTGGPYGSKQDIMRRLASDFHQGGITCFGDELRSELMIFEYEYTRSGTIYSAPAGYFDDGVNALALANHCLATVPDSQPGYRGLS